MKKLYLMILMAAIYLIDMVLLHSGGKIANGITYSYCLIEFVSITENGGKLGIPMPDQVKKIIQVLKDKQDKEAS